MEESIKDPPQIITLFVYAISRIKEHSKEVITEKITPKAE